MSIQVRNVTKRFGHFVALRDVSLEVQTGELLALLGPSGSGKTTLLRIIAGLESPDVGSVILHGEDATTQNPKDRRVGFVFQHYALFRHMTVFKNIAFGLTVRPRKARPSKAEIRDKVFTLLKLVQLENFADRYPAQLSGGQRQRVALARALAVQPRVLLLDEPFGALDAKVRKELRRWLRRLHDEIHVTSVFVTHDQEEALEVADRVVIMNNGAIEQLGSSEDVYHHPANAFVYNFLGDVNLFHGRVCDGKAVITGPSEPSDGSEGDRAARVFVRPHLLDIVLESTGPDCLRATVEHVNPAGPYVKVELTSEWGDALQANVSQERYRALDLRKGMAVFVVPKEIQAFATEPESSPRS
ncbi:MAG TPA: sulfate ABC transporter ATP-binding protein [Candidatus Hydrogenedentes bacterium]|nr:sulfate ABC transporter ATP-binding protein [Candidatus Hydrogenedentota bacterium]HPG70361.1 sulfate ABC transporter ATP-binding protein [Candidatus Hydrogenedentota bacterium]